ncbi:MAG: rod shape-determining protein MreD, partial [Clostridia bacterium]
AKTIMKIFKKQTRQIVKWILYYFIMFFLFILQTTPGLFAIGQARPVFLYTLVVLIAFFEQELPSAVFGMFCGLLIDYSSSRPLGFNAFFLVIIATVISLLTKYLIRSNFTNFISFSAAANFLIINLDFFFSYIIWNHDGLAQIYSEKIIWIFIYSVIITAPLYYLFKFIALKFNRPNEDRFELSE